MRLRIAVVGDDLAAAEDICIDRVADFRRQSQER